MEVEGIGEPMAKVQGKLPGDATAPGEARRLVGSLRRSMDPGSFQRAQLLVNELVTAAVRESCLGSDGCIQLTGTVHGAVARFEVNEVSPGYEPGADQSERPDWGWMALNELADAWGVVRGEYASPVVLWFEIYLEPVPALSAA